MAQSKTDSGRYWYMGTDPASQHGEESLPLEVSFESPLIVIVGPDKGWRSEVTLELVRTGRIRISPLWTTDPGWSETSATEAWEGVSDASLDEAIDNGTFRFVLSRPDGVRIGVPRSARSENGRVDAIVASVPIAKELKRRDPTVVVFQIERPDMPPADWPPDAPEVAWMEGFLGCYRGATEAGREVADRVFIGGERSGDLIDMVSDAVEESGRSSYAHTGRFQPGAGGQSVSEGLGQLLVDVLKIAGVLAGIMLISVVVWGLVIAWALLSGDPELHY